MYFTPEPQIFHYFKRIKPVKIYSLFQSSRQTRPIIYTISRAKPVQTSYALGQNMPLPVGFAYQLTDCTIYDRKYRVVMEYYYNQT